VIENNLALFQEKTGCHLNPSEMFEYITTRAANNIFKNSLNKSQALTGILFGYGTLNALGFESFSSANNSHLSSERRQQRDHEDSIQPFTPFFSSFSAEETENLMADYRRQREEILKIYTNKTDFLEITRLC
jgi:hypothetical protein